MFPESRDQKLKYNVDCPLLMSEYIRGVTIRGFSVSVIFINNSRKLCSLFVKIPKSPIRGEVSLRHRVLTKKDVIILCEELKEVSLITKPTFQMQLVYEALPLNWLRGFVTL